MGNGSLFTTSLLHIASHLYFQCITWHVKGWIQKIAFCLPLFMLPGMGVNALELQNIKYHLVQS